MSIKTKDNYCYSTNNILLKTNFYKTNNALLNFLKYNIKTRKIGSGVLFYLFSINTIYSLF